MSKVVVVGSGASGVHFALSALAKGHEVTMLDVGNERPAPINPADSFDDLKASLDDPAAYFLGSDFSSVLLPGAGGEYYGFPPSKDYVFSRPAGAEVCARGFNPIVSFARGGLAEAWTAGVYPFNDDDLADFPFSYADMAPYYAEVALRIGVSGVRDDLERFMPFHDNIMAPLDLDRHSNWLLHAYAARRDRLNDRHRCFVGRSRIAVLTAEKDGRQPCSYLGRCLWGCPSDALYTPSISLAECRAHPGFTYAPRHFVTHFRVDGKRRLRGVIAESTEGGGACEIGADALVLAAGTLSSTRIFLNSIREHCGEVMVLPGLMDNPQALVPFASWKLIGEQCETSTYQFHQLGMGIETDSPKEYIHCQVTTLGAALAHPIVQGLPVDARTGLRVFRNVRGALGIVNINLHDDRSGDSTVTLEAGDDLPNPRALVECAPRGQTRRLREAVRVVKSALRQLGCFVPPGMTYLRPPGSSVHYAGTVPMATDGATLTASELCESHDFDNVYFVDGTTFPFLPAKNITFTLMANAVRVADNAF